MVCLGSTVLQFYTHRSWTRTFCNIRVCVLCLHLQNKEPVSLQIPSEMVSYLLDYPPRHLFSFSGSCGGWEWKEAQDASLGNKPACDRKLASFCSTSKPYCIPNLLGRFYCGSGIRMTVWSYSLFSFVLVQPERCSWFFFCFLQLTLKEFLPGQWQHRCWRSMLGAALFAVGESPTESRGKLVRERKVVSNEETLAGGQTPNLSLGTSCFPLVLTTKIWALNANKQHPFCFFFVTFSCNSFLGRGMKRGTGKEEQITSKTCDSATT